MDRTVITDHFFQVKIPLELKLKSRNISLAGLYAQTRDRAAEKLYLVSQQVTIKIIKN